MSAEQTCPVPEDEPARLAALRSYEILDTEPELEFDAVTRVASHAFDAPIAVVALMDSDRLWFKSRLGLDVPQLDRKIAFCAHAIMRPRDVLVVPDLQADARFSDNPLVAQPPHIRFYAGAPIVDTAGHALGTIAVIDAQPRSFTEVQRHTLKDLSTLVMMALRGRRRALDLERLAMTDHLTGIANRARFDKVIVEELGQSADYGSSFGLLVMDLDGFKAVNDRFGHAIGDEVLCVVARRLVKQVRTGDTLARLGGDEFAIVMRQCGEEAAEALARRIVSAVKLPINLSSGDTAQVGISVGVAIGGASVTSASVLLGKADEALYQSKRLSIPVVGLAPAPL